MTPAVPPVEHHARKPAFRGDIEGLRAIAVGIVLLYHVAFPGITGGFAGVDVFFVISGFLITSQLVKEVGRTGTVSLPGFYARRARRLLPAASLVLLFSAVAGWFLLPEGRRADLGTDVVAATLYVVNWALAWRSVDYLAEDAEPSLVQHYWSLSVEEQFYVVWPLLILLGIWLARRLAVRVTRVLGLLMLTLLAASLVYSIVHTQASPATAYFVTTTRAWEMAIGAMLVFLTPRLRRLGRPVATLLAALGLALIAWAALRLTSSTPWPGSAALVPTLGTAMVIGAGLATQDTPVARLLGVAPLRFVGGISYSLYLWHWPLLQLLEAVRPGSGLLPRLGVAALSVLAALASKKFVEDPVRFQSAIASRTRNALVFGAVSMALTAAAGATVLTTAPRLGQLPSTAKGSLALVDVAASGDGPAVMIVDPTTAVSSSGDVSPDPSSATKDVPAPYADGCQLRGDDLEPVGPDECWFGDPDGDIVVALVGDSKVLQWFSPVESIALQEGWRVKVWTRSGCGFARGIGADCTTYNERLAEVLTTDQRPDIIITSLLSNTANPDSLAENLRPAQEAGTKVVLLADTPGPTKDERVDGMTLYECVAAHPDDWSRCTFPRRPGLGSEVLEEASVTLDAPFVDLTEWVCPDIGTDTCPPVIGGVLAYRQGAHITDSYARTLTPVLHRELVDLGIAVGPAAEVPFVVPEPATELQ